MYIAHARYSILKIRKQGNQFQRFLYFLVIPFLKILIKYVRLVSKQIIIICSRQTLIFELFNQPNKSDFWVQEFCVDNGIRKMQTFFQNFFICTSQVNLLTQLTQNYDGNWDHLASLQKLLVFLTTQRGQPKYFKNVGEKFGKNFPSEYHEAILCVHQLHALNFCSPNCGNFDILFPALEILAETKKLHNTKRNKIGIKLELLWFIRR